MATTIDPQLSADSGGTPDLVGGGITRLNASDGLFLRAQHLNTMEDYSLALSRAVGIAAGTGVVYGYRVTLEGTTLKVTAGLAMGPDGQPLRSNGVAEVDISNLTLVQDEFIVVEVGPADWDFGQENMYGNLCTDPCSQGGQIQPYRAEGIAINLHHDTMPGLTAEPDLVKRNWLASAYYEREREQAGPWLVPYAPGTPVLALDTRDFSSATAAPGGKAVPLAALLRLDGGEWVVDVWIARRDIGDPAPRRAWQSRLAMRPWDVFIAQVLQFQAQFNDDYQAAQRQPARSGAADDIAKVVTELRGGWERQRIKPGWLTRGLSELEKVAGDVAEASQPGLRDQGFYELPPAGYLPPLPAKTDLTTYVNGLFGASVDLRIRHCRADYAVRAVEQAQHLDRIPLDPSLQRGRPRVDVLVPSDLADLDVLYAESYPWLAFVRGAKAVRRPRMDEVAVYLVDTGLDDPDKVANDIAQGLHTHETGPMMVSYPADTYAVPTPQEPYDKVQETLRGAVSKFKPLQVVGVGLASAEDRQPLAAVRAFLFVVGPPLGGSPHGGGPIEVDDIAVGYKDGLKPEEIVIVYGQRKQRKGE